MKRIIYKILRVTVLSLIIFLAVLGIGIGGAVPVNTVSKRDDKAEIKIELLETVGDEDKEDENIPRI